MVEAPPSSSTNPGSYADKVSSVGYSQTSSPPASFNVDLRPLYIFGKMDQPRAIVQPKIHSTYNGMPSISFPDSEVSNLSVPLEFTLIGKFELGIPRFFAITNMLKAQKFNSKFTVSFLNKNHVVITLFVEKDFNLLWAWENPSVEGHPLHFVKWTPTHSFDEDLPVVPVWVTL